jgi:hypothetical protein
MIRGLFLIASLIDGNPTERAVPLVQNLPYLGPKHRKIPLFFNPFSGYATERLAWSDGNNGGLTIMENRWLSQRR